VITPTLVRTWVTLITDPFAARRYEDGPDRDAFFQEGHEIVIRPDAAAQIPLLREDMPVSLRVLDHLTERILILIREDETTVLAAVDDELTAELAMYWADAIAAPV
jgi:hypothetical protein